jgi:hypothetical protein
MVFIEAREDQGFDFQKPRIKLTFNFKGTNFTNKAKFYG